MKVILLGFRYSGKSVIGKIIAKQNGLKFIDLDEKIEEISKEKIAKIVSKKNGWQKFRELEIQAFNEVIKNDNVIISCGGGFGVNSQFCDKRKMTFGDIEKNILKNTDAIKILFEIDECCLLRRIKSSEIRPNFNIKNSIEVENLNLYNSRKNLYNSIDFDAKIDTSFDNFSLALQNNKLFCIIGNPCWHSLSPIIHNSFYNKTFNKNDFLYTKLEVKNEKFDKIGTILKLFNIKGASITSPFKQEVKKILSKIDNEGRKIEAVNTIVYDKKIGGYIGYNTDWYGVVEAINNNIDNIKNKRIAIFGSGGGAKSAVIGCLKYTKNIAMFNRTESKNSIFARQNGVKSYNIKEFNTKNFDIIINATTVGLNNNKTILTKTKLQKKQVVFDMVYSPLKTKLLNNAIDKKCKIIYGTEMLIYQAKKQFELFCNTKIDNKTCIDVLNTIQPKDYKKCISVQGITIKEFLKNLRLASKHSDFVELRVDYIKDLSKKDIKKIADEVIKIRQQKQEKCNKLTSFETIFTCRLLKDGGFFDRDFFIHKSFIEYAISLNVFDFIDFDISCAKKFEAILKNENRNFKSIVSYHNFNKCLTYKNIKRLIDKMYFYNSVPKVAMKISNSKDLSIMISILEEYNLKNKNIIFAPMGDKLSRIIAYKFGSFTNFICLNDKQKTATGQLSVKEFDKIICDIL